LNTLETETETHVNHPVLIPTVSATEDRTQLIIIVLLKGRYKVMALEKPTESLETELGRSFSSKRIAIMSPPKTFVGSKANALWQADMLWSTATSQEDICFHFTPEPADVLITKFRLSFYVGGRSAI
jgi:hypothetical protein